MNAQNGATIRRKIGTMLDSLSLPIDKDNPAITRKMFERAMGRLCSPVISSWSYVGGPPTLKRYGWLETWLNLSIDVTASLDAQQHYKQITEKSEIRRERADVLEAAAQAKQKIKGKQKK